MFPRGFGFAFFLLSSGVCQPVKSLTPVSAPFPILPFFGGDAFWEYQRDAYKGTPCVLRFWEYGFGTLEKMRW
jgi:hypothetical protein